LFLGLAPSHQKEKINIDLNPFFFFFRSTKKKQKILVSKKKHNVIESSQQDENTVTCLFAQRTQKKGPSLYRCTIGSWKRRDRQSGQSPQKERDPP